MKVILFNKNESSLYFEENELSDWCAWLDLYNKLEWFMLVARYIVFIHSKKETFLESTTTTAHTQNDIGFCPQSLLAAAVESFPPHLLSED